MRKLHPSYEIFVKEQRPKYGKTFTEWYSENYKIGDIELLPELCKKNKCFLSTEYNGHIYFEEEGLYCFKDFFTKKLQLCSVLMSQMVHNPITYELGIVSDITDLYEDVIQEICTNDNVSVTILPSGKTKHFAYTTTIQEVFVNIDELKEEFLSGEIIVYDFFILENFRISIRYFKRELLTRNVLVEK